MNYSEVELLSRAHQLFAGDSRRPGLDAGTTPYGDLLSRAADLNVGAGQRRYQLAVDHSRAALLSAARTDAAAGAVITGAQRDRAWARRSTGTVLDEARSDTTVTAVMPIAQREAIRRRVARLRAQRAHVLTARRRARRHLAALRALRYRVAHGPGRAGQTSAAVAERSRRHRGPRRAVATWPSLCLGRNGAQPVRLFRFGPVGLRPGGCSPGSHHLSTDQRGDPGAALTGPAGRSGLPAPRARAAGDRQQSGRRGAPCGRVGSGQLAGQQRADSATAEWQIIAQSDGQDEKVEPCRSKPGLR